LEKPILFNTEMVQAILEGRKTQTRRIIKFPEGMTGRLPERELDKSETPYIYYPGGIKYPPYSVGDILWVRETWCRGRARNGDNKTIYKADIEEVLQYIHVWKPSIHMSRAAARIFLKVTDVRVERLQDITHEEILKEGTNVIKSGYDRDDYEFCWVNLWDLTCTKKEYMWNENPWVWVIEFERL
jgi:hypothetical protein